MQRFRSPVFLFLALLLITGALYGQGTTTSLSGAVTSDGSALPGATVTVSSPNLQGMRVTVTDVNGNYNFVSLPPGDYKVVFQMEGMASVAKTARLSLASAGRVDAAMVLSKIAESITVTAAAPAVVETTQVVSNFDAKMVETLPTTRTVQAAVQLAPGVTANGPGGAPVIGGGYAYDSLYLLNGAVANENLRGQTENLYIEDAIQETSVITASVSAEYGRFTGGVVSAITKSGGNEYHGSVRDTLTNAAWSAVTKAGEAKPTSAQNNAYEATFGGRIIRDRLWFFGAGRKLDQSSIGYFTNSTVPMPTLGQKDKRYEGKLTGQVTSKHSLVGSFLSYDVVQKPQCSFGCFDISTMDIDGRELPRTMKTLQYNGVLTNNFLLEGNYSDRSIEWRGSGGNYLTKNFNDPHDIALGTVAFDQGDTGAAWGAPVFCGVCDTERRWNKDYLAKATYFLSSDKAGTHSIVAGYDSFTEHRFSNNYQSGSNFMIYTYGMTPERESDGSLRPIIVSGDDIVYSPVPIKSKGSDFVTDSLFVNDKWDLNRNWSFNVGVRYDKNDGKDSAGNKISKDSNISPRLGVIYDVAGNRQHRLNASYSKYVARIQESVGGGGGGGNPWYVYYTYDGPQIGGLGTGMGSFDVLTSLFTWFLNQGGLNATDLISGARVPGFNTRFTGDLKSPNMDEWTIGYGTQLGSKGFIRADYIDRKWHDFYVDATAPHDQVENPIIAGTYLDVLTTRNAVSSDNLKRTYRAVELQAAYRFLPRLSFGANYTWSQAKGNTVGESTGLGPFADQIGRYVQYKSFKQNNPVGFLPNDQTHKARAWMSFDQPLGPAGNLNFGLLERFDSGTPYSAVANVNPRAYVTNPGYASTPSGVSYYFSDRGAYRWDSTMQTDVSVNYSLPVRGVEFFAQGQVTNVFDQQKVISGGTSVTILKAFNPWTDTPVEGVNWKKSASFGKPTGPGSYRNTPNGSIGPRTYRASLGVRF